MRTHIVALAVASAIMGAAVACSHSSPRDSDLTPLPAVSDDGRELTADQQVAQVLNRLEFGPRPGDAARVRQMGVDRWIARQLAPDRIPDPAAEAFLAHFPAYRASAAELARDYPRPERVFEERRQMGDTSRTLSATDSVTYRGAQQRAAQLNATLVAVKVGRAVSSERQLQEVMTDFWENHFNVDIRKNGQERYYLSEYDRDVIRAHALGKFRDLLEAVAKSPAMLYYLDNWESVADSAEPTLVPRPGPDVAPRRRYSIVTAERMRAAGGMPQRARRPRGLNENYGRELLELHTLGVDAGYTQQDVINVARAFTGWSVDRSKERPDGGEFVFRPRVHDAGEKVVLGHVLPAGRGIEDGEAVLDIVARHPTTARFIATKLCRRFVSDTPPPGLVDRVSATFTATDGDLRDVMWTLVTSPEFYSRAAYRAKVKSPFEVVVSALRAVDAAPDTTPRSAQFVAQLGEPLFQHQAPNGYPETGESWMNTGAILARINFGLAVAASRVPGASLDRWPGAASLRDAPRPAQVDGVVAAILGGDVSPDTRQILLSGEHPFLARGDSTAGGAQLMHEARDPQGLAQVVGLALGAPEFQRR
jgi:uncharacterized protein (DUF1800 family)